MRHRCDYSPGASAARHPANFDNGLFCIRPLISDPGSGMLSRFAKFLLVASSLAPVLITWAFADWRQYGFAPRQASAVILAIGLAVICRLILIEAHRRFGPARFTATELRTADSDMVGFVVAYLLPLVGVATGDLDYALLLFVMALIGLIVWSANAYSVNPLLALFGFHFYEVSNADGVSFLFLSKRDLRSTREISTVVQLTRYVLLDSELSRG